MRKVYQTLFGSVDAPKEEVGNCYPATLASILELELEDVPHFYSIYQGLPIEESWAEVVEWLRSKGCVPWYFQWPIHSSWNSLLDGAICVFSGESPRFPGVSHAVVGKITRDGWELMHDPHPEGSGFTGEPSGIELLVRLNPIGE